MKPYPFWLLNHFTVPSVITFFFQIAPVLARACIDHAYARPSLDRVLGKSSVRRKARGEAKSFRPKLDGTQHSASMARLQATVESILIGQESPRPRKRQ